MLFVVILFPKDIDECAENGELCEHVCHNKPGSYDCDCDRGGWQFDITTAKCIGTTCDKVNGAIFKPLLISTRPPCKIEYITFLCSHC